MTIERLTPGLALGRRSCLPTAGCRWVRVNPYTWSVILHSVAQRLTQIFNRNASLWARSDKSCHSQLRYALLCHDTCWHNDIWACYPCQISNSLFLNKIRWFFCQYVSIHGYMMLLDQSDRITWWFHSRSGSKIPNKKNLFILHKFLSNKKVFCFVFCHLRLHLNSEAMAVSHSQTKVKTKWCASQQCFCKNSRRVWSRN